MYNLDSVTIGSHGPQHGPSLEMRRRSIERMAQRARGEDRVGMGKLPFSFAAVVYLVHRRFHSYNSQQTHLYFLTASRRLPCL
jgi:hypothetical protein